MFITLLYLGLSSQAKTAQMSLPVFNIFVLIKYGHIVNPNVRLTNGQPFYHNSSDHTL